MANYAPVSATSVSVWDSLELSLPRSCTGNVSLVRPNPGSCIRSSHSFERQLGSGICRLLFRASQFEFGHLHFLFRERQSSLDVGSLLFFLRQVCPGVRGNHQLLLDHRQFIGDSDRLER
jgi:hypothetical protein